MSDHDDLPTFSGPGDPREEALWEAYQAMLRRRKEPRARWSPPDMSPPARAPGPPTPAAPPDPRPAAPRPMAARRIPPRPPGARPNDPGPIVFHPIEEAGIEAPPPHFTLSRSAKAARGGGRLRAALGVAVLLACGAALAIVWPRGSAPPIGAGANPVPGATPATPPADIPAQRPSLPCFVDGQLIGEFTLEDCASRNGVASGSLQANADRASGAARAPASATPTRASDASTPAAARPPAPAEPPSAAPLPAPRPSRFAERAPSYRAQPSPRLPALLPRRYADASAAPPAARRPRYLAPWGPTPVGAPPPDAEPHYARVAPATPWEPGADAERRPIAEVSPKRASALAVREFYTALGQGDGARAASVVVPEKRQDGPLSADALTQFYSSLRAPLRVTKVDPINDDTVFVRYEFVTRGDRLCLGSAMVNTTHRDGETLVRGIRTFNGC